MIGKNVRKGVIKNLILEKKRKNTKKIEGKNTRIYVYTPVRTNEFFVHLKYELCKRKRDLLDLL